MSQDNWKYPKLANYVTVGIIAIVVIIGFLAFDVYEGNWNNPHTIYPQPIKKPFYNATLTISSENQIISKEDFSRDIVIRTSLHTTSLSAQNPITVTAISDSFDKLSDFEYSKLPDSVILRFPDSLKYPLESLGDLSHNVGYIQLYLNDENKRYEGTDQIIYQFESEGGYYLQYPHLLENLGTKYSDGTVTISITEVGDSRISIINVTKVPIEPMSATVNMEMTNTAQAISLIVISIGVIQFRKTIIHAIFFLYDLCWNAVHRIK